MRRRTPHHGSIPPWRDEGTPMKTKDKFETIEVERPEAAIRRIVMNRSEARNARNLQMTHDLNAAFDAAVQDAGISQRPCLHDLRRLVGNPARDHREAEFGAVSSISLV